MLNDRQERFCKEYLVDCNAAQAYIRAGYSPKGAHKLGSRLKAKADICARIDELMAQKDAALIATADEVLKTLTRILRREERETTVVTLRRRVPVVGEDGRTRYEERETAQLVDVPPRLCDVNRAAELLGKRYGLWAERVELSGEVPVIVDDVPQAPGSPAEGGAGDG